MATIFKYSIPNLSPMKTPGLGPKIFLVNAQWVSNLSERKASIDISPCRRRSGGPDDTSKSSSCTIETAP